MVVLCATLCMIPAGEAGARSPDHAVIRLSCATAPEALCQAVIQALAETAARATGNAAGGATGSTPVIRRVPPGQERPARAGDLGLALVLAPDDSQTALSGHLDWQSAEGARNSGPELRVDVMDATVTPQTYASFADALLRVTPEIARALARTAPQ